MNKWEKIRRKIKAFAVEWTESQRDAPRQKKCKRTLGFPFGYACTRILSNRQTSGILGTLPTPSQWKEVRAVDTVVSFALSVLAGVISYYICKWLDNRKNKK